MMKLYSLVAFAILAIVPFGHAGASQAELRYKTDFTADDFKKRREAIYEEIGDNYAIIQAAEEIQGFIVFRQSNTFYYLSGLEVPSAYLLLDGRRKTTTVYIQHRNEEGYPTISYEDADLVKKITGAERVRPIEKLGPDFYYDLSDAPVPALYTPHSLDEKYQQSRDEMLAGFGRRLADPFDGRPSKAGHIINLLRLRYPQFEIRDLSAALDKMRTIKDKKEIALIRKASQLAMFVLVHLQIDQNKRDALFLTRI
jgi:Xaa-Pro aminopeptidase